MNKTLTLLTVAVPVLTSSVAVAELRSSFPYYAGADAQVRHMGYRSGFGDNLFKHDLPQGNVFLGITLSENFRLEAGYEANAEKTRTIFAQPGEVIAGASGGVLGRQLSSSTRIHGPHISLVGVLPLDNCGTFKLFGMIGVANLKMNLVKTTNFVTFGGTNFDPRDFNEPVTTTFLKRKNILKLGVGLEHKICQNWAFRAMLGWENTKKFNIPSLEFGSNNLIKPHNSILYSMGVFTRF